jgi:LuxR family maltose regulon positive regulatory protein
VLERLCASLCDAVTRTGDSAALLERIERSNLLLVPLDTRREWYRYHHLFGEVLRHQLGAVEPALVPELHRRASAWLRDAGFPSEAIHHAGAAGDHDDAAELIVTHWLAFRDEHRLETILAWLDVLPAGRVGADPRLALVEAATLVELGRVPEGGRALDAVERHVQDGASLQDAAWVRAGARANRAVTQYLRGDVGRMGDTAKRNLDGAQDAPYWQSVLLTVYGAAQFLQGRSRDAAGTLDRAALTAEAAAHMFAQSHALGWKAAAHAEIGEWEGARHTLDRLEAILRQRPHLREYYGTALGHVVSGRLLEHEGRTDEAQVALRRGVTLADRAGSLLQRTFALLVLAAVEDRSGNREGAVDALGAARRSLDACADPGVLKTRGAKLGERILRSGATDGLGVGALSERELEVARLVAARKTNPEIAAELFVSVKTVESHTRSIFRKLGVSSRMEVARAMEG